MESNLTSLIDGLDDTIRQLTARLDAYEERLDTYYSVLLDDRRQIADFHKRLDHHALWLKTIDNRIQQDSAE